MKRSELKEVLKPLIKECIKEVLFEDGVLSGIIAEVVTGLGAGQVARLDDLIRLVQVAEQLLSVFRYIISQK